MKLLDFKKAQSGANIILPMFFLLLFGIMLLLSSLITFQMINAFVLQFPTDANIINVANTYMGHYKMFDYVTLILCVAFIIGIAVTSYRIRTSPVYYIVTFITAVFYGFVAYILSYTFSQYASNPVFVTILYLFNITILLLTNLHWLALVMIIIGAITLYSKSPDQELPLR